MARPTQIEIDKESGVPVYIQLAEQIRLQIHRGILAPGSLMPTVRGLAVQVRINANTVARVYQSLQRDGLLRLERGVGTFVSESAGEQKVTEKDFVAIAEVAKVLIARCREAGIGARELGQYLESLWKEESHG